MHDLEDLILCITAYNEAENLEGLFADIAAIQNQLPGLRVRIRDNGSSDNSGESGMHLSANYSLIEFVCGRQNLGYGGGMREVARSASSKFVAILPADRQYPVESVVQAIRTWLESENHFLAGRRTLRTDGWLASVQSKVYSLLCRVGIGLSVGDINGLPKIFPRDFLEIENFPYSSSFFFDAQLLLIAKERGIAVTLSDVEYHRRREGASSWATKRVSTVIHVTRELYLFRRQLRRISQRWGDSSDVVH